jgi:Protein of unknown function (DUF3285)
METSKPIPESPIPETPISGSISEARSDLVEDPILGEDGKPKDSFVKLAMRNMVKKRTTSLFHFGLTTFGVLGTLLGLAIAFH